MPLLHYHNRPVYLMPSILSADFARLGEQAKSVEDAGADGIQIDIMDGVYVPNISVGLPVVASLRKTVSFTLDCHLMIVQPERYISDFVKAGADHITVHVEATTHLHRTIQQIKEHGITAGVALNPATPLTVLDEILPDLDLVLLMSVNPGFGGQDYIQNTSDKIRRMRQILESRDLGHIPIQIDGGVKTSNIAQIIEAGATSLVVGSAIYNPKQTVAEAVGALRQELAHLA
jgi:ribulose-phosphate 3-epimerase